MTYCMPTTRKFFVGPLNDMAPDLQPSIGNVAAMADMAAHAGIRVLIASVPQTSILAHNVTEGDINEFNNGLVQLCAAHGYTYVNYSSALQTDHRQNTADFMPDGIHPNAAGYAAMWAVLERALNQS